MLRLRGIEVDYDTILSKVPLTEEGADLESLRRVASEYGLQTEVRKLSLEDLEAAPKPILVHIETPATGTGRDGEPTGHFTIITKVGPDGDYRGIDTTNALFSTWHPQYFARNGTGYCLLITGEGRGWLLTPKGLLLGGSFLLLVALNIVVLLRTSKSSSGDTSPTISARPKAVGAPTHA